MTKSTITREQLIKKAQEQIEFCRHTKITGEGRAHVNQCAALFEIALAAMDSEPVAISHDTREFLIESMNDSLGQDSPTELDYQFAADIEKLLQPLYRHAQQPVVPETAHSSVIAEQLAHVLSGMDVTGHQRAVISCAVDRLNNVAQLLQLSPSALLVPEILDYQGAKELYNYLMTEEETNATVNGWNACRAAMLQESQKSAGESNNCRSCENVQDLQAGNSPAQGGSRCSIKAAPALDSSPKTADARCGSSPVIPDCWIPVSERMPEDRISVILWDAEIGEVTSGHYSHKTQTFYHCGDAIENEITHWMPPPCAPQEVKR